MFAFLALLTFLLALFGVHIGTVNMLLLGLAFIAAHLLVDPLPIAWPWRRRQQP